MPIVQDEDIRIYELPEAQELTAGMKVAVDSETDGTKSFDLSNLAGKVDAPSTAPEAGQILTFDGTENTWGNPPEGVYVLNLSDVNNYTDIDLARAKSQPTYIRIDEGYGDVTIDIPYNNGSTTVQTNYTVVLKAGTTLKLSYIKDGNNEFVFTTIYEDGFYSGGPIGSYGTLFPMLYIRNDNGYLYKWFKVSGELNNGSLNGGMPVPFTKYYHNSRGNGSLASDRNAVEMQFQWDGNIRKQCLLPGEIINHDFYNDTTPEQIQFMGWGATSNRAGYKNLITAQHNYDSTNYPMQTPQVQFLKFKMSGGTPESDQVMNVVQATMKSADGQNTEVIGGILVPTISDAGVLQTWSDSNGSHYGWKPVSEVPTSTAQDEGKVLTVDSNGAAAWAPAASGSTTMAVDIPSTLTTDQEIVEFINTTVTAFNADSTKKSLIVYPPDSNVPYVYLRSDIVDPFYAHHFSADLSTVKYRENVNIHSWDYGNAPYSSPGQRLVKIYYKTTPQNNPQYIIKDFYSEPTEYKRYEIDSNYTMAEKYDAIVNALNDFYSLPDLWRYKGPYFIIGGYGEGPLLNRIYQEGDSDIITFGKPNFCSSTDYQRDCEFYPVFEPFLTFHAEFWTGTPVYRITKQVASCGLGFMPTPEIDNQGNVDVSNNQITVLEPTVSALTAIVRLGSYSNEAANFCLEITPTVQCTLTIKTVKYNGSQDVETTLKHSVAAGNVLEANKTYQVTAVGNCWTLAEFEA